MARRSLAMLVLSVLAAGCGGGPEPRRTASPAAPRSAAAPAVGAGGRLVAIGHGRRLYAQCAGSGRPTVVLEAGFPGDSTVWNAVQPQLARTTRTCAYDRAGLGSSPPARGARGARDARDEIDDLRRLLGAAHLPAPYVLVGHSYGGMLAQLFARTHPSETAGVVLVDARGRDATRRQLAIWPPSVATSARRAVFRRVQRGVDLRAGEAVVSQVRSLGAVPLAVVTAGHHDKDWGAVLPPRLSRRFDALWTRMQDELAALSADHVHVVALRSDHFVQALDDGQPDVVVRAVAAVVRAARNRTRLPPCGRLFGGADVRCAG